MSRTGRSSNASPSSTDGAAQRDAFVVVDCAGRYWTGEGWSREIGQARRFDAEPDPYADASRFCARAGRGCVPLYLPRQTRKSRTPGPTGSGTQPSGGRPIIATA